MFDVSLPNKTRRDFMKLSAAGVGVTAMSGWMQVLASHTNASPATNRKSEKLHPPLDGWRTKP